MAKTKADTTQRSLRETLRAEQRELIPRMIPLNEKHNRLRGAYEFRTPAELQGVVNALVGKKSLPLATNEAREELAVVSGELNPLRRRSIEISEQLAELDREFDFSV